MAFAIGVRKGRSFNVRMNKRKKRKKILSVMEFENESSCACLPACKPSMSTFSASNEEIACTQIAFVSQERQGE